MNIIDWIVKIGFLIIIVLILYYTPMIILNYETNDPYENIENIKIAAKYNFFGYLLRIKTTHESYDSIPYFKANYVYFLGVGSLFFLIGMFTAFFIGNLWKSPIENLKELKILGIIVFCIFLCIMGIIGYFSRFYVIIEQANLYYDAIKLNIPNLERNVTLEIAPESSVILFSSLLFIVGEIFFYDKFIKKNYLVMPKDSFWVNFINKALKMEENQFWDFKQTLEMWKNLGKTEKKKKEIEFCEKVTAFANNKGGILILGITNEFPRKFLEIKDLENKMQTIKMTIKKWIDNKSEFFILKEILLKINENFNQNCLLIVVAQTKDVVGVRHLDKKYSFPIRLETGLERVGYYDIKERKVDVKTNNNNFFRYLKKICK